MKGLILTRSSLVSFASDIQLSLLDVLFLCIVVNLFPYILLSIFDVSSFVYSCSILGSYLVELFLIISSIKKENVRITSNEKKILLVVFLVQVFAQVFNLIQFHHILVNDILNIFVVTLNIVLFLFVITKIDCSKDDFVLFMKRLVLLGLFTCAYNIVNIDQIFSLFTIDNAYSVSISSIFPNRNMYGQFLLFCTFANMFLLNNVAPQNKKRLLIVQIVFVINIVLTLSRNALMGLVVFYISVLILNRSKIIKKLGKEKLVYLAKFTVVSAIVAVVFLPLLFPSLINSFSNLFLRFETIDLNSGRLYVWISGLTLALKSPLLGFGRFQGVNLFQTMFDSSLNQFHNIWIETLVEFGLVGVFLLILVLYFILKNLFHLDNSDRNVFLAGIFTFLFTSFFESLCRFSLGYVDFISLLMIFALPILFIKMSVAK